MLKPDAFKDFAKRLNAIGASVPDPTYYETDQADPTPILEAIIGRLEELADKGSLGRSGE